MFVLHFAPSAGQSKFNIRAPSEYAVSKLPGVRSVNAYPTVSVGGFIYRCPSEAQQRKSQEASRRRASCAQCTLRQHGSRRRSGIGGAGLFACSAHPSNYAYTPFQHKNSSCRSRVALLLIPSLPASRSSLFISLIS